MTEFVCLRTGLTTRVLELQDYGFQICDFRRGSRVKVKVVMDKERTEDKPVSSNVAM